MQKAKARCLAVFALIMFMFASFSQTLENTTTGSENDIEYYSPRAQTVWSGVVELTESYHVSVADELIISPCTSVKMDSGTRIFIDGRILIEGTSTCPVILSALSSGLHEGIQFNSSSLGRGSLIENLTIENSMFGITIYGSDPIINDITIINPSRVGIDMFSSASPEINNVDIIDAGDGFFYNDWRYGLGISVGAGSDPVINSANMSNLEIRGLNIWGASSGTYQNIFIDNVSAEGASAISAGVWVEDSTPVIDNIVVDKSDYGILIRHIDDGGYTMSNISNCVVSNSMYRGIYVDKANHTNYTNYQTAYFANTQVLGTGGQGAKTANIGYAAIDINATGAFFENTLVENSTTVGLRLYLVDSTTTFNNLTIRNSGDPGQGAHEAGLAISSSFFAPLFDTLEITGSVGPGIHASSGGSMTGSDWILENNTGDGLFIDSSTIYTFGIDTAYNGQSGIHVYDSRYVVLGDVNSRFDGQLGLTNSEKAGIYFEKSNDIESNSGDVTCAGCYVYNSSGSGVLVENSVDLYLIQMFIYDASPEYPALSIDNSGLNLAQQGGTVHISVAGINSDRTGANSGPGIEINQASANINFLGLDGDNTGLYWNGNNNGDFPSSLSNTTLFGDGAFTFVNHKSMSGFGNKINPFYTGQIILENSNINWSYLTDFSNSLVITLDSLSQLRLHNPSQVDLTNAIIAPSAQIDVAWDLYGGVFNSNNNGIPGVPVTVSFDQFESNVQQTTDRYGNAYFFNFIGQRWTSTGVSPDTTATVSCSYDGVSNSTDTVLDSEFSFGPCILAIDNQPPFVYWDSPLDESTFSSGAEIEFDASESFDIDDDPITFEWTSSIDGIFSTIDNFVANSPSSNVFLSDGLHTITLKVCDDKSNCVEQSRIIELTNLEPVVYTSFTPNLNEFNELYVPMTGTLSIDLTGTYDPEGDDFSCWVTTSYGLQYPFEPADQCPLAIDYTFSLSGSQNNPAPPSDQFTLSVWVDDGVNPPVERQYDVVLYNEIPEPIFTVIRDNNLSESTITFDGTSTQDPEGDNLEVEFYSNIDGILQWSNDSSATIWQGHLSRGLHTIEMRVTDDLQEHLGEFKIGTTTILVENSPPRAVISPPDATQQIDSSDLILLSANGSGDFDSHCDTFDVKGYWHCSQNFDLTNSEYLQVFWSSDLDGILSNNDQSVMNYQTRLSSGVHTITLEINDGINEKATSTINLDVQKSAPVLNLAEPLDGSIYDSYEQIYFDPTQSIDYDGDQFTMTVISDLMIEPIIENVSTSHGFITMLPAGEHTIQVILTDTDGMSRAESIELTIQTSPPEAIIISPTDLQSFAGGTLIELQEESFDADFDISFRQWTVTSLDTNLVVATLDKSTELIQLSPGDYEIELHVRDSQSNSAKSTISIRVEPTDPVLDQNSLVVSNPEMFVNELITLDVSVFLSDPDGTTDDVYATITHGLQVWNFVLYDTDGDGTWNGSVEMKPEKSGRPSLKITAKDGVGDSSTISQVSKTLVVIEQEETNSNVGLIAGGIGLVVLLIVSSLIVARIRSRRMDMELIESWDVFGGPKEAEKEYLTEVEGGGLDGAGEVWSELEQQSDED